MNRYYSLRLCVIQIHALNQQHPDVAQSLNNLAELYRLQGNYSKAEPLYVRSLAILEKVLGGEHPIFYTLLPTVL
ncbi:MAG: tetratricopeptide repeat protein [Tolypothrix brevis GSE-NOS-MK-07-07A]|nr:tetratricopeptide repeat protein [Tolypothrix brevis GSE-NOS-MK-07-07A]